MADGGFAGGFARGFSGAFQTGLAARQARENAQIRQQQQEALEEHRQFQRQLQEKQLEIRQRQADNAVMGSMLKLFEPGFTTPARKFMFNQFADRLDIPRDAQTRKDFEKMVTSMDTDALNNTKTAITGVFQSLPPGAVEPLAKAVISGQITLDQAFDQARQMQVSGLRAGQDGQAQPQQPGADLLSPTPTTQQPGIEQAQAGGAAPAAAPSEPTTPFELRRRSFELLQEGRELTNEGDEAGARLRNTQAQELRQLARDMEQGKQFDVEEVARRAEAEAAGEAIGTPRGEARARLKSSVKGLLGISGADLTRGEAEDLGIFTDQVQDPKVVGELLKDKAQTKDAIRQMGELGELVRGRPELLGAVGSIARGIDTLVQQMTALPELIPGVSFSAIRNHPKIRGVIRSQLAEQSAEVQSRVTELSFAMANAVQSGRISNQQVERSLQELGASGSADQFTAVLEDLENRFRQSAGDDFKFRTGVKPLDLMSVDELLEFSERVENPDITRAILREIGRRR